MDLFTPPPKPAEHENKAELFFAEKMELERKQGWFKPEHECYYTQIYQDYIRNLKTGVSKSLWICWHNAYKFIYEL